MVGSNPPLESSKIRRQVSSSSVNSNGRIGEKPVRVQARESRSFAVKAENLFQPGDLVAAGTKDFLGKMRLKPGKRDGGIRAEGFSVPSLYCAA